MNQTPNSNRLHIALLGRRNMGKSCLINALTGQDTSIVSIIPGTTTDPVSKPMEIHPLGACLLIDTPGFDDDDAELGGKRVARTLKAIERADVILFVCGRYLSELERKWVVMLKEKGIPLILVVNKADTLPSAEMYAGLMGDTHKVPSVAVSAKERMGINQLFNAIVEVLPADSGTQTITGDLVSEGDVVLLIMPQDIQAPKGRLILPQVQTLRELLDKKCLVMSCTTDKMDDTLRVLARPPRLIVTDSQVFHEVYRKKPAESLLTSFSVLFAGYKGDIRYYMESAAAIDRLTERSRVLIAEACTHAPLTEDIGRVKLPRLLRKRVGEHLQIDIVAGSDFPEDLSAYDLVIHCGACMFNRKYVLSRIARARAQGIPMTNYGVAIAYMNGILDKICVISS